MKINDFYTSLRRRYIFIAPCKRSVARGRVCPTQAVNSVGVTPPTGVRGGRGWLFTPRCASLARGYKYMSPIGEGNEQLFFKIIQKWGIYGRNNICKIKMIDFWENNFKEKQTMWGFEPAESAIIVKNFFIREKVNEILIAGIGYGRNAKIFLENGIYVTGIEISETAIRLARTLNKLEIPIYHGSVAEMPFDSKLYDGIFSYALIHLLNYRERKKFISDCYSQLKSGGYMFFSTIAKKDSLYAKGKPVSKDRFEVMKGAKLFFYDTESIKKEFEKYGLVDFLEVEETIKFADNIPPMSFTLIKCKKV